MQKNTAPTKGNLMSAKNTLRLSKQGYEMLDKKRNILIREMMQLIEEAKEIEAQIENLFAQAYHALEAANMNISVRSVEEHAHCTSFDNSIQIDLRSVMGVELPVIHIGKFNDRPTYGFADTSSSLDEAFLKFNQVKQLTVKLAEIENSVYRLAVNIKKTQKRANALENITIPMYDGIVRDITNSLEEKDREEHSRLKVLKNR